MAGLIIWLIGLILTIKAALEIWKMNGDFEKKVIVYRFDYIDQLVGTGILLFLWQDTDTRVAEIETST